MTLGEKLKKIRTDNNMTIKQLADYIEEKCNLIIDKSMISRWENDKATPVNTFLSAYAKAFNVNLNYLIGLDDQEYLPKNLIPIRKIKKVPIVGTIACGSPILAEENIDGYFSIDPSIDADYCLKAKGDSMIDIGIHDGDLIFLRQQPVVENGEVGAVLIGEEATLKKVYINENEMILQPCNKNYPPMVVKGNDIKIMGKLVGYYHNMDK